MDKGGSFCIISEEINIESKNCHFKNIFTDSSIEVLSSYTTCSPSQSYEYIPFKGTVSQGSGTLICS
jgi:hypothetical protein